MSLLAPLYILGALAIALPVIFHLIRRTPQGRQDFSSLMFLAPSPPRITRRSRLNNILLLLLRAAALALLAFAFARPFLRTDSGANVTQEQGRRVAILIDASASMRRGDLWQRAVREAEQSLRGLAPGDEAAVYVFDRGVRPVMTFSDWNETERSRIQTVLSGRLATLSPSWDGTNLGDALATAADLLAEGDGRQNGSAAAPPSRVARQLVLISDMQEGGRAEALQGHQWPDGVMLEVKPVSIKTSANAGLQAVKDAPGPAGAATAPDAADPTRLRVRITNAPDSTKEQFTLAWATANGPVANFAPVKAYVPPGRSQVVRVPWPAPGTPGPAADRLVLSGDDFDFDNTLFVVPPRKETVRVVYLGDDAPADARGLLYYFQNAAAGTPLRAIELVNRRANEPVADADLLGSRLAVVSGAPPDDRVDALRRFASTGGDVLWVLTSTDAGPALSRMMGVPSLDVREGAAANFSLISRVDFDHPLFAPFSDTRFGDFTKIHFWKHRRVAVPGAAGAAGGAGGAGAARAGGTSGAGAGAGPVRVVASFDNGDPFLLEQPVGQGRLLVMTSGWQPADSQMALSTKFVPLVDGLLRRQDAAAVESQYAVHEPIALPRPEGSNPAPPALAGPGGRPIALASGATTFDGADRPGIYRLTLGGREVPLAVNVHPDESRTAPMPVEELEQYGAKLGTKPAPEGLATRQRQLQVLELENRQKLWRWLIVAVLGLLAVETALAGRLARRTPAAEPGPEPAVA